MDRFDTEEKCRGYLMEKWWQNKPTCPHCKNAHMNYYIKKRDRYTCRKCLKQFSITSGTIFHCSKIPLKTWFLAIYLYSTHKKSMSSFQLAKWCNVRQATAWLMLSKIRKSAFAEECDLLLSGTVQCDETLVAPDITKSKTLQKKRKSFNQVQEKIFGLSYYKRKKMNALQKRGPKDKKVETKDSALNPNKKQFEVGYYLFGICEENTPERKGRAIVRKIGKSKRDVNKENIYPIMIPSVLSSAVLFTDEAPLYNEVTGYFNEHHKVVHKVRQFLGKNGATTNAIEGLWSHIKDVFKTYTHVSYKHLDGYLDEFIFRWNRRDASLESIFEDAISLGNKNKISYLQVIESPKLKQREKWKKEELKKKLAA